MSDVARIAIDELLRELCTGRIARLWRVQPETGGTGGMIPGSRRLPVDAVARTAAATALPREAAIVVYGGGPHAREVGAAAAALAALGFTNVRVYDGGMAEWRVAGLAIEHDAHDAHDAHDTRDAHDERHAANA